MTHNFRALQNLRAGLRRHAFGTLQGVSIFGFESYPIEFAIRSRGERRFDSSRDARHLANSGLKIQADKEGASMTTSIGRELHDLPLVRQNYRLRRDVATKTIVISKRVLVGKMREAETTDFRRRSVRIAIGGSG